MANRANNAAMFGTNGFVKAGIMRDFWGIILGDFLEIFDILSYVGYGPLTVTVGNEGLWGSPTKNVIILVVTVTVRGPHPIHMLLLKRWPAT